MNPRRYVVLWLPTSATEGLPVAQRLLLTAISIRELYTRARSRR